MTDGQKDNRPVGKAGLKDPARAVEIYEVGPRDGLQNEAFHVPTDDKIALIDALSHARPAPFTMQAMSPSRAI